MAGEDVTARVVKGTYRTPAVKAGKDVRLKVRVSGARADAGDRRTLKVKVSSDHQRKLKDTVAIRIRALG